MAAESTTSIVTALAANAGIAAAKFIGALFSGSASMMAEGIHSLADTGNEILLLVGIKRAGRPPDPGHPLGYGRERYFWSFIVAISLFVIGAVFSVLEGIHKLLSPSSGQGGMSISLAVLAVAAGFEAYSFRVAYRVFTRMRGGRPFFRSLLETKDPAIITVLSEDSAGMAGIAVAAAGLILSHVLDSEVYDAAGSIVIGALLAAVAVFLGRESKSMLIGESASLANRRAIRAACQSRPGVLQIVELLAVQIAPEEILVNLRLRFIPELTGHRLEAAINDVKQTIRRRVPAARRIVVEPYLTQ